MHEELLLYIDQAPLTVDKFLNISKFALWYTSVHTQYVPVGDFNEYQWD